MQNGDKPTLTTFSYDGMPEWEKAILEEQGFNHISIPALRRIGADQNGYNVYSNKTEFTPMSADSVYAAIKSGEIVDPYKVTNIYCRIDDIIPSESLEKVETPGSDVEEATEEAAEKTTEEMPTTPPEETPTE